MIWPNSQNGQTSTSLCPHSGRLLWIRKDPNAYNTFCRLIHNTGHKNKAITAMARKLAVHLWKMACDNKPYSCAV
jgi:hypothetical protein